MKRVFVLLCILFTVSGICLSKNVNKDSIITTSSSKLVLDKELKLNLKQINSNLHDICLTLSSQLKSDSVLASQGQQLFLETQIKDDIKAINSNLSQMTQDNTILGLSWDVFITLFVTIFVFVLGYILNELIKSYERYKETKDYREIVFFGITSNEKSINNNTDKLNSFATQISSTEDIEALRLEYAMTEIHKLSTIPFEKYVSVFLLNSKLKKGKKREDKNIYNLISTIDYLSRVESMVFEQYNRYKSDFNALFESCNSLYLKAIGILHDKYVQINNGIINDAAEIAHYSTLINLIEPYVTEVAKPENKEKRGSLLFSMFVTPIETEVNKFNNPSSSIELLKILGQFEVLKRQWESNKQGYSLIFADYKVNVETVYAKLKSSVNYFKEDTRARIW